MTEFLTPQEVAEMFNISKSTLYRLMDMRKIPFFKIGGSIRLSKTDVNQYLEDHTWDWSQHPKIEI